MNSATTDALVARGRTGLRVSDELADILSDRLDTIESVADSDILWVKFAVIFSDAGKDKNKNFVSNLAHDRQTLIVFSFTLPVGCQHFHRIFHFSSLRKVGFKLMYFDTHTHKLGKIARMMCFRDYNIQKGSKRQRHASYFLQW